MGSSHVDLLTGTLLVQSLAARLKERVVATPTTILNSYVRLAVEPAVLGQQEFPRSTANAMKRRACRRQDLAVPVEIT